MSEPQDNGLSAAETQYDHRGIADSDQGAGHFRASIARYKARLRQTKPYYIAAVEPTLDAALRQKVAQVVLEGSGGDQSAHPAGPPPPAPIPDVRLVGIHYDAATAGAMDPLEEALVGVDRAASTLHRFKARAVDAVARRRQELEPFACPERGDGPLGCEAISDRDAATALSELDRLRAVLAAMTVDRLDGDVGRAIALARSAVVQVTARQRAIEARLREAAPETKELQATLQSARRAVIEAGEQLGRRARPPREQWVREAFGERAATGIPIFTDFNLAMSHSGSGG